MKSFVLADPLMDTRAALALAASVDSVVAAALEAVMQLLRILPQVIGQVSLQDLQLVTMDHWGAPVVSAPTVPRSPAVQLVAVGSAAAAVEWAAAVPSN